MLEYNQTILWGIFKALDEVLHILYKNFAINILPWWPRLSPRVLVPVLYRIYQMP